VALPILLLINLADRPLNTVLTGEALSQEIVRTLVGSIGLVLSVPLTRRWAWPSSDSPVPRHPRSRATGHRPRRPTDIRAL
jgi:hypothetical protein